jgi:hypothetical protein
VEQRPKFSQGHLHHVDVLLQLWKIEGSLQPLVQLIQLCARFALSLQAPHHHWSDFMDYKTAKPGTLHYFALSKPVYLPT